MIENVSFTLTHVRPAISEHLMDAGPKSPNRLRQSKLQKWRGGPTSVNPNCLPVGLLGMIAGWIAIF